MTTPAKSGPDYTRYSLERLQEARRNIDTERFPERTHLLDVLIADRQLRGEVIPPPPPPEPGRHSLPEPKTPGQALLMMAASVVFLSIMAALSYHPTTTHPQDNWFVMLIGVIGAYQIIHLAMCYVRLKKLQQAEPAQPDTLLRPDNAAQPPAKPQPGNSTFVTKTKPSISNTSPIERM